MVMKQSSEISKLSGLLASIRNKIHSIPTKQMVCKDVTFAQMRVIRLLEQFKQVSMKDIAYALQVTLPTATGLVDNLVHNGYLKRHQEANDRRVVHVSLSSNGHKLLNAFSKTQHEWLTEIRNSMTSINWRKFIRALETIDNLFDETRRI